jgi:thiosulfate dehydrogenase
MRLTLLMIALAGLVSSSVFADEFTQKDVDRWQGEFAASVQYGRQLWTNAAPVQLGTNGVACAQCHPNAANTHPETYPKFQKQIGRVAALWEMINWCIRNPLEGKNVAPDSKESIALQAYIMSERKGVKLAPGKH